MGNAPSGGKRRNSNEDVPPSTGIPANKKLIIRPSQDVCEADAITRILAEADVSDIAEKLHEAKMLDKFSPTEMDLGQSESQTIPTVFKWEGGGKDVFLSGTFNGWRAKIPMVKSKHNFYTIVELPKGEHQYKFIVDGAWKIDNKQGVVSNDNGSQNNMLSVKSSDFDVLEALRHDIANSKSSGDNTATSNTSPSVGIPVTRPANSNSENGGTPGTGSSPPGNYGQEIPQKSLLTEIGSEKAPTPPLLPPQLLQVILNKETGVHCDPNLLPQPNHVMINHMYALSIKDGVIVLSAIARYRQKFVSTVMYKPI